MEDFKYLFEQTDINTSEKIEGKIYSQKNVKTEAILLDRFKELDLIFPETIEKNESLHIISSDNFGSIELLKVILKRFNVKEINLTTWSYNEDFIELVKTCLENSIAFNFFVDKSIKTRKAHLYAQIVTLADLHKNLKVKIHHMLHSKVTLIKTYKEYLSIESSANYSKNQRIENYTISNSENLFNFHKDWMNKLIGE
jgi:tRNA isopentenyl-2-thiomethyl-A-37 hydroxylase MiaE